MKAYKLTKIAKRGENSSTVSTILIANESFHFCSKNINKFKRKKRFSNDFLNLDELFLFVYEI